MSSSLLEKLTEEANALTEQERRILAARLLENTNSAPEEKSATTERSEQIKYRKREYQWMKEHKDEYAGQWVALEGNTLFGHGSTARQALNEAKKAGAKAPFIARIESPDDLPFGGW